MLPGRDRNRWLTVNARDAAISRFVTVVHILEGVSSVTEFISGQWRRWRVAEEKTTQMNPNLDLRCTFGGRQNLPSSRGWLVNDHVFIYEVPGSEGLMGRRLVQGESAEVQAYAAGLRLRKRAGKVALSAPQHIAMDVSIDDKNTPTYWELNKTEHVFMQALLTPHMCGGATSFCFWLSVWYPTQLCPHCPLGGAAHTTASSLRLSPLNTQTHRKVTTYRTARL